MIGEHVVRMCVCERITYSTLYQVFSNQMSMYTVHSSQYCYLYHVHTYLLLFKLIQLWVLLDGTQTLQQSKILN